MNDALILWQQKANSKQSFIKSILIFLYEFVGARFTVLAFIALFNVLTYDLQIFSVALNFSISVIIYLLFQEAFKVFWTGINLTYLISSNGIHFRWGVFRNHELFLPYKDILGIHVVHGENSNRQAIVFSNKSGITNSKYGFSSELYSQVLSFENVKSIKEAQSILRKLRTRIEVVEKILPPKTRVEKFTESNLYIKGNQLLAFIYLYISIFMVMSIIDNNYLDPIHIKDKVVNQYVLSDILKDGIHTLQTSKGYEIHLNTYENYLNEQVSFSISPLFGSVVNFDSFKYDREWLVNGYASGSLIFKYMAIFTLLSSCLYVLYHKGVIPLDDFPLLLFFPLIILFVSECLFY